MGSPSLNASAAIIGGFPDNEAIRQQFKPLKSHKNSRLTFLLAISMLYKRCRLAGYGDKRCVE
jgi:hypothetical protein